jgi:hypothetical protein
MESADGLQVQSVGKVEESLSVDLTYLKSPNPNGYLGTPPDKHEIGNVGIRFPSQSASLMTIDKTHGKRALDF